MLAHYRNEMTRSYFVVMGGEEHCASAYQLRMLLGNQVEGLLRVHTRLVDGKYEYYYDITGKQSWLQYLEHHPLTREEIARLVLGLNAVIETAEKYLLDYHQLILEPGYIYLDHEGERIYFGYRLDEPMQFEKSFQAAAEKLIEKVDHKDREACALAYGIYETARQPGFHMEEILELLRGTDAEKTVVAAPEEIREETEEEEEKTPIPIESEKIPKKKQWLFCAGGSILIWLAFSAWILLAARESVFWIFFSAGVMGLLNWCYYQWEKKNDREKDPEPFRSDSGNMEVLRETAPDLPFIPDRKKYRLISMTNGTEDLIVAIYQRIGEERKEDLTDRE